MNRRINTVIGPSTAANTYKAIFGAVFDTMSSDRVAKKRANAKANTMPTGCATQIGSFERGVVVTTKR